jgi:hypothetical protein
MNKYFKTSILTILLLLTATLTTLAQEKTKKNDRTKISVEVDPATFVWKGYGIHLRIQPKNFDHLLIGFGTYALDMPNALVDLNSKNKNKGWNVRINQGYSLFGEHHFTEVNKKWFIGAQIGIQEFKIGKEGLIGNSKFKNFLGMIYVGYTFKPFKNNLYIKPWLGIGYTTKISGSNILGNNTYDIDPLAKFATVHIGYTF